MDQTKRLVLFLIAATAVIFGWNALFPPAQPAPAPPTQRAVGDTAAADATAPGAATRPAVAEAAPRVSRGTEPERFVIVRSPLYEYWFSTRGAALRKATLPRYESYVHEGGRVQLVPPSADDVLARRVVVGGDTLDFRDVAFRPSADSLVVGEGAETRELTFVSTNPGPVRAEVTYVFRGDNYLVDVRGRITGLSGRGELVTELGTGLATHDAPEHGSARELAIVGWNEERIERLPVRKVRGADTLAGPLVWAGLKDRYFLLALINDDAGRFGRVLVENAVDRKYAVDGDTAVSPRAHARTVQPLAADGTFRAQAYLGPQEHGRLSAVGHQLQEVNPYGYRWLRPVVRPIAAFVLWLLNLMHENLGLAYGWVLIVFGVLMRLVTWPLNAKAMRAQMKNMEVQPLLQARMKEVQQKYASDQQRQGQEMMKVYQELGVNPFSMMSGCLPLLIPMPVLITLFFVFQSAIEFRGTSFAWLPDLSLKDPWNILPVFLVVSMFGLQWISTRLSGMEQNPQMRMMMYTMPLAMGFVFFMMPAGLNLYYASTNVASIPQQLLIARERKRASEQQKAKAAQEAPRRPARSGKGGRR